MFAHAIPNQINNGMTKNLRDWLAVKILNAVSNSESCDKRRNIQDWTVLE